METNDVKRCFLISPIGQEDTDTRDLAKSVYKFLNTAVLTEKNAGNYNLEWAGYNSTPSLLTDEMFGHIMDDDLAIALMDGDNPNVYYEMGIRHTLGKSCINIISDNNKARKRPFDVQNIREIQFPYADMVRYEKEGVSDKLLTFQKELCEAILACKKGKYVSPVQVVSLHNHFVDILEEELNTRTAPLQEELNTLTKQNARLQEDLNTLTKQILGIEDLNTLTMQILGILTTAYGEQNVQSIGYYVEGEDESFKKLAETVKQAENRVKVSLFAPQEFYSNKNEAKEEFFDALCSFGKVPDPTRTFKCIMGESPDVNAIVLNTQSNEAREVCSTSRKNNFELGAIDESTAFLCFYDEQDESKIKSTLFITEGPIIHEIEKIYDQIWVDSTYEFTQWTVKDGKVVPKKEKTLQLS